MKHKYYYLILIFVLSIVTTFFIWKSSVPKISKERKRLIEKITSKAIYEYGIPIDSFTVVKGYIRTNQTLGELLEGFKVKPDVISNLPISTKGKFDLADFNLEVKRRA